MQQIGEIVLLEGQTAVQARGTLNGRSRADFSRSVRGD